MTKTRFKENNDESTVGSTKTEQKAKAKPMIDFMPGWAKEEACFKNAIVRDFNTKKIVEGGWPRPHRTDQWAYENWLSQVINQETGNFFQARKEEGSPIDATGAMHVINVITRVRDAKGRQEFLLSKGSLIGYDAGGVEKRYPISYPDKWRKTELLTSEITMIRQEPLPSRQKAHHKQRMSTNFYLMQTTLQSYTKKWKMMTANLSSKT